MMFFFYIMYILGLDPSLFIHLFIYFAMEYKNLQTLISNLTNFMFITYQYIPFGVNSNTTEINSNKNQKATWKAFLKQFK